MDAKQYNKWEAKQLRQAFRNVGVNPSYIDTRSIQPLVREWRVNVIGGCSAKQIGLILDIPGYIKMDEYGRPGERHYQGPYYGQHFWFKKGKIKRADSPKQPVFDRTVTQRCYVSAGYVKNNKHIDIYSLSTIKTKGCYVVDATFLIRSQNHPELK